MRGTLTGLRGSDALFDTVGPAVAGAVVGLELFSGDFSGVLPGLPTTVDFGRRLLGLFAESEAGVFCFGRDVRNAPRTLSSSCSAGAAVPITTAPTQTIAKRRTLNRITLS